MASITLPDSFSPQHSVTPGTISLPSGSRSSSPVGSALIASPSSSSSSSSNAAASRIIPAFQPTRRIGLISTYPPKQCGLATFAAALGNGLTQLGHTVEAVALVDQIGDTRSLPVSAVLLNGNPGSLRAAVQRLAQCDFVLLQHEFGIFGGPDGDEAIEIINRLGDLGVPVISTLHTVPLLPTSGQRDVLLAVIARSTVTVVMSKVAHRRLISVYGVPPSVPVMIPHGATLGSWTDSATSTIDLSDSTSAVGTTTPHLLTWGLLGPGKGIEHVIDALGLVKDDTPPVKYTVAGVTHPNVLRQFGDVYRDSLKNRAVDLGVRENVRFDATYRTVPELVDFVSTMSAVVLPYDSCDQVTSGVLVDAIAAGRPVIATAFPHAVEMLASGAGIVVPNEDPVALADAIRTVCRPEALARMTAEARRIAPSLSWKAVAQRYVTVGAGLRETRKWVS